MIWVLIPLSQFAYWECYNIVSLRFSCYDTQVTEASALQQESGSLWLVVVLTEKQKWGFAFWPVPRGPAAVRQQAQRPVCTRDYQDGQQRWIFAGRERKRVTELQQPDLQEYPWRLHRLELSGRSSAAQEMFEWCCSLLSFCKSHPLTWASLSALRVFWSLLFSNVIQR